MGKTAGTIGERRPNHGGEGVIFGALGPKEMKANSRILKKNIFAIGEDP